MPAQTSANAVDGEGDPAPVVGVAAPEQPALAHGTGELGVKVHGSLAWGGLGLQAHANPRSWGEMWFTAGSGAA